MVKLKVGWINAVGITAIFTFQLGEIKRKDMFVCSCPVTYLHSSLVRLKGLPLSAFASSPLYLHSSLVRLKGPDQKVIKGMSDIYIPAW